MVSALMRRLCVRALNPGVPGLGGPMGSEEGSVAP